LGPVIAAIAIAITVEIALHGFIGKEEISGNIATLIVTSPTLYPTS
jgi:hypothetical protein